MFEIVITDNINKCKAAFTVVPDVLLLGYNDHGYNEWKVWFKKTVSFFVLKL